MEPISEWLFRDATGCDVDLEKLGDYEQDGFHFAVSQSPKDAVRRFTIRSEGFAAEFYPSKGMSLGQVLFDEIPIFWSPPLESLPSLNPEQLNEALLVDGKPTLGVSWLRAYTAGIELLGLTNWGMPYTAEQGLPPLHGEASVVSVSSCKIFSREKACVLIASYRVGTWKGGTYLKDLPLFQITKEFHFDLTDKRITAIDHFSNISGRSIRPDWGYHINPRAEENCKMHIDSEGFLYRPRRAEQGDITEENFIWRENRRENKGERTECGTIVQHPKINNGMSCAEIRYSNKSKLQILFTASPFVMIWNSSGGGRSSKQFCDPETGESLFANAWNSLGLEIGNSDLDHLGESRLDERVCKGPLLPRQSETVKIEFLLSR